MSERPPAESLGRQNPTRSRRPPVFRIYQKSNPAPDAAIIDIDGRTQTPEAVRAVFDHHRSGERVNMDALPASLPGLEGHELATHKADSDYLISAVLARLGGAAHLPEHLLRVLRSASEWCDLIESEEPDAGIRDQGRDLHLYISKRLFVVEGELCARRGELRTLASGGTAPDPSDETASLAVTIVARDVINAIRMELRGNATPGILPLREMRDAEAIARREENQARWRAGVRVNDDLLALVVSDRDIDSFFALELVRGKLQILALPKLFPDGRLKGYKYRISLKPSAYAALDLRPLLIVFNEADPHVRDQVIPSNGTRREWGGRDVVMGSAYEIESGLTPENVERIVRENTPRCARTSRI